MFKVAIDGPGGAGKSTISKAAAKQKGFVYIDTGAMYRAAALFCMRQGIDIQNSPEQAAAAVDTISIDIDYQQDGQHIYLNGEDVSEQIRSPEVSMGASEVSAIGKVRERLVAFQRELAASKNVIMDGRDIGTKVLPDAQVKIFLTASAEVRAKRRYDELVAKGDDVSFHEVLKDIEKRDRNDETRAVSPLKPAEDSVLLDTSALSFAESLQAVVDIIDKKLKN
ncbi:(d)CMP kinase [Congzhengia sp.]|uniref:(d)CMP kinase n=1 Tax=Congzhengia sp. TaxID=2944168 RepID=UPI003076DE5C